MGAIDELAERYWRTLLEPLPEVATLFGDHERDDRMGTATAAAEEQQRRRLLAIRDELTGLSPGDDRERVIHDSLADSLHTELIALGGPQGDGPSHALLRCEQMTGPQTRVLRTLLNVTYPEPEHAAAVPARYADVGRFLDEFADRFAEGVGRGLTPVARNVQRTLDGLTSYIASDVAEDGLVAVRGPEGWDGDAAWREQLRAAVRDHVRPAIARYRDRLEAEQLPHGRDDEHAGLCHLDGGLELYADLARVFTTLTLDPDDIHRTGVEHVEGQLAEEWSRLGEVTVGESDPRALMELLRDADDLRYASSEEMVQHAEEAVARAAAVMGDWFGRLPTTGCIVRPIPEHESASAAPAYYVQPAPDGSRPGTYFVNAHDTGSMLRTEGEATAFHEAIPGHHLQLAISGELEGVPAFLRYGTVISYVEGWGLYAERLADEMGLYTSDHDRLGILSLDAFRAARLVVDTGLHARGWSRQQAIDWMVAHTPLPVHTIATEVDRYLAIPGQALAYKIGQMEILRLRWDAERRLGDAFDIRGFHDTVLGQGMLTLPVLAGVVDRWVSSRA